MTGRLLIDRRAMTGPNVHGEQTTVRVDFLEAATYEHDETVQRVLANVAERGVPDALRTGDRERDTIATIEAALCEAGINVIECVTVH